MIWFTSDQHYAHGNIIPYMGRPFKSVEEMGEVLSENHNAVVGEKDLVYHLGDFSFHSKHAQFLEKLNGKHFLIKGNHDNRGIYKKHEGFEWVKDVFTVKWKDARFFLSHYSHRVWPRSHYGVFHLYGHSHGSLTTYNRSMDVGVDANNFTPINAEQVIARLEHVKAEQVDHHALVFGEVCNMPKDRQRSS
jgi:calcineurin-like phosphoesterase family protein